MVLKTIGTIYTSGTESVGDSLQIIDNAGSVGWKPTSGANPFDSTFSFWKLDEWSGIRYDSHGNNHLLQSGIVDSTGTAVNGRGAVFNKNIDNGLFCPNPNASLSVGDWDWFTTFRFSRTSTGSSPAGDYSLITKTANGGINGDEFNIYITNNNNFLNFQIYFSDGSGPNLVHTTPLIINQTYFAAAWWDKASSKMKLRVDNITVETGVSSTPTGLSGSKMSVGFYYPGIVGLSFDGWIDDVMFARWLPTSGFLDVLQNGATYPFFNSGTQSSWPNISNLITGAGTTNYIPLWVNTTGLGNSFLSQNGNNLGLNNSIASYSFDVIGNARYQLKQIQNDPQFQLLVHSSGSADIASIGTNELGNLLHIYQDANANYNFDASGKFDFKLQNSSAASQFKISLTSSGSNDILSIGTNEDGGILTIKQDNGQGVRFNYQNGNVNTGIMFLDCVTCFGPVTTFTLSSGSTLPYNHGKIRVSGLNGAATISSTPSIKDGYDGQLIIIQGAHDTNTVTLRSQVSLASSNLELGAATRVLGKGDILGITYDRVDSVWYELFYTDNSPV